MTLPDLLRDLQDSAESQTYSRLTELSVLSSDQKTEFEAAWGSVPSPRRREVVSKLVELSEDNLELDFNSVFRVCLRDMDEYVREKAAQGLWESDDRSLVRPLIRILLSDPSPKVRATAAMSLRRFAVMAQDGKLISRDAERIRGALLAVIARNEEDREVRRRAIEAVACFDTPEIDQIIREAHNSGDLALSQSSIYAMGQSSNAQWLPLVLIEIDHDHAAIRYEAAVACGLLGDESTVPHLVGLVEDDDIQVQLAAVRGLGILGGALAKRALQQCVKSEDEALSEAAQEALTNIEFDDDPLAFKFEV